MDPYEAMSDEELNKAVAERKGWTFKPTVATSPIFAGGVDVCDPDGHWVATHSRRDKAIRSASTPMPQEGKPCARRPLNYCGSLVEAMTLISEMLAADWRSTISTPGAFTDEGLGGGPIEGASWAVSVTTPGPETKTYEEWAKDQEKGVCRHVYATAPTVERAIVLAWLRFNDARRESVGANEVVRGDV